jgi:16S rRNA (uracil1498-N3)-methyltransferase
MPRFYVDAALRAGTSVPLPEDSAHHALHVLRVHAGDEITLFNGRGGEYAARIASIQRLKVLVDVLAHHGVAEIQPVLAASSVARPKGERAAARHAHWQKVAIAACEQCGRNQIPKVQPMIAAAGYRGGEGTKILLAPRSELGFSQAVKGGGAEFTIAAGPEAGFNADEERAFLDAGFVPARLGPRVLRTETAGLAALAALSALRGDF